MVAKNTAETDDQIIDLTELIEKGEVPANDPSEQPQAAAAPDVEADQEALNEHLRGLNDGSNAADAEIDDLLAQMDIKDEGQDAPNDVALDFSAPSTQTDHPIDPNEQLLMPGMGDVDNLLNALDIPPQPSEREPEIAAPASASPVASQAADDAVDALLNDFHATAPAPQASAEPQNSIPDLDELLASVSAAPATGNTSDIDDLLNAGNLADAKAEPATAAPSAAQSPAFSNDDLDSLLAAAANGLDVPPSPAQAAAPAPAAVSAPASTPAPAPAASPDMGADLGVDIDSLLAAAADDLQGKLDAVQPEAAPTPQPNPVPAPAPAPTPAASPDMGADLGVDIDSLLAAAADDLQSKLDAVQPEAAPATQPTPVPAPAPAPAPAASPDMGADLGVDIDSLLAAAADDLQSKLDAAQPETAPAPASEPQPDLNADLDSLLAAVTGGAAPASEPQEEISDVLLHPELELMADAQPEPVAETLPDSSPELEPVLESVQAPQPEQAMELPTDFDALLAAATEQAATDHADVASADMQDIMADASAQAESDVFEAVAAAEPAQADELPLLEPDEILPPDADVRTEPSVDEPAEMEAAEVEPDAADMPESAGQFSYEPAFRPQAAPVTDSTDMTTAVAAAAVSGAALEAVMEQAKEASSHAIDAFAQAFDASTRAADAAETASKLTERVEQCEAALQEAGDRIIALETALEAQIHASHELAANSLPRQELEDMFVEGHPLHQSLMDCIGKAVAAALASAPPPQAEPNDAQSLVEERLQPVVTAARSATARIDALETRLDALEPRFNDRVERAAAAAAARILREEIGRLLEDQ
ncbi:hypothetical protein JMF94_12545 [Desulfovibrio sp. UIB00]|nr:hypothetical protein [Desulfovibrio sp. UIB00]